MPEVPGTLAEALIRLQASLPRITKDAEAQAGNRTYPYADLASIHAAVFPLLADLGLYWTCCPGLADGGRFVLHYTLGHAPTGDSLHGDYPLPEGVTPQAMGGAITYARRYAINAVLGIAPVNDDDDAAAAESQAKASYEARVAAGRMSREQMREHGQLERDVKSSPRKAERIHGPADDDPWAMNPENAPGSITPAQVTRLGVLFSEIEPRITRADRLSLAMKLLDLPELASSKDLSFSQAETLARKLQDHITEGEKS